MWDTTMSTWTKINGVVPTTIFASRINFYAIYPSGIWEHDGTTWKQAAATPPNKMLTPQ